MDADSLRRRLEPLERKYRDDPASAAVTCRSTAVVDPDGVACRVRTGPSITVAGLHRGAGGTGADRSPADMLLEALVGCAGVTLRAMAARLGLDLRSAEIEAEGEIDLRGALGVDPEAPVGFKAIRLSFAIDARASEDMLVELVRLTERHCVIFQTLSCKPAVSLGRA